MKDIVSDSAKLAGIMKTNRANLETVPSWISDADYENSVFNYGLPRTVRHLIDAPIGAEVTYADILALFATSLKSDVRYLEIGVSVGKTFFQMLQFLKNAKLVALDIEDINPILESFLEKTKSRQWSTPASSLRKRPSSWTDYAFLPNNNSVHYLAGDVFDDATWSQLSGLRFNVVFSDAFHSGEALLREWQFIRALGLLDPAEFVMIWDDLGDSCMRAAFSEIAEEMRHSFQISPDDIGVGLCRGWLGTNEHQHPVGIVRKVAA